MTNTQNIIKNMRLLRGMTQQTFASAIGVSVSTVKQWERGNNYIAPENLGRIRQYLLSEYDNPTPDEREYVDNIIQQLVSDKL